MLDIDIFKTKIQGSIDIGSSSLKGLSIKKNKINNIILKELESGVVVNGNIEDYLAISEGVKFLVEELDLKNKEIAVSIPIQNFFIKFIEVNLVDENDKMLLIESELEELVPNFESENFITDYISLGLVNEGRMPEGEQKESIMAITILKTKIKELLEILTTLKVIPVKIVPDFVPIFNLVQESKVDREITEEDTVMILDVGSESTKIFIERDGIMKMQRIVAIGGNDISEIIQRFYNVDRHNAELEKRRLELLQDIDANTDEYLSKEAFMEVAEIFNELENQIKVSIDFYKSHEGRPGIDHLYIFGGTSLIKGFRESLEKMLDLESERIEFKKYLSEEYLDEFNVEEFPVSRIGALLGNVMEEVEDNDKS